MRFLNEQKCFIGGSDSITVPKHKMSLSANVVQYLDDCVKFFEKERLNFELDEDGPTSVLRRAQDKMIRYAVIHAVGLCRDEINLEDATFGFELAWYNAQQLIKNVFSEQNDEGSKVLRFLKAKRTTHTMRDIFRNLRSFRSPRLSERERVLVELERQVWCRHKEPARRFTTQPVRRLTYSTYTLTSLKTEKTETSTLSTSVDINVDRLHPEMIQETAEVPTCRHDFCLLSTDRDRRAELFYFLIKITEQIKSLRTTRLKAQKAKSQDLTAISANISYL